MPIFDEERKKDLVKETDYTPVIVAAVGATALLFGGYQFIKLSRQIGSQAAENFSKKGANFDFSKNVEKFKKMGGNIRNLNKKDFDQAFSKENLEKMAQNSKKMGANFNVKVGKFGPKMTPEERRKMEDQLKTKLDDMYKRSGKDGQKKDASPPKAAKGGMFDDIFKEINKAKKEVENEFKASQSGKKADSNSANKPKESGMFDEIFKELFAQPKKTDGPPPKAGQTKQPKAADSEFTKFFEDLLGYDKHLQGGFEESSKGGMSVTEARRILQFQVNGPPPKKDTIMENYHILARANHPDMGGSDYLTAKINEAKDVLIRDGRKRGRR